MKKILKKGFTLIELIVVIVIIGIFSFVAVISVTKWIFKSRDSLRKNDLNILTQGLINYISINEQLPTPQDDNEILNMSGATAWYQGVFGKNNFITLKGITKEIKDPMDGYYYDYSISGNKKKFQILTFLEDEEISLLDNKVYAKQRVPYIQGNYNGYLITKFNNEYTMYNNPSIITNPSNFESGTFRLTDGSLNLLQSYKGVDNIVNIKSLTVSSYYTSNNQSIFNDIETTFGLDNLSSKVILEEY